MIEQRHLLNILALCIGSLVLATSVKAQVSGVGTPAGPVFRPEAFFLGRTEGTGILKIMFRRHRVVHVHGDGRIDPSGALILDQDVEDAGKPVQHRRWKMQSLGGGSYAATLSDATGPVVGTVERDTLRLVFREKGGFRIKQSLVLLSDGKGARNRLTIRKMGIVVATLNETIRRID